MGRRFWQLTAVFLTCVVPVLWSVVQNSVAGVSEWEIATTGSRVWYSDSNETLISQRTTESPDTWTDHWVDTSFSGVGQAVDMTSTPISYVAVDDTPIYIVPGSDGFIYLWDKTKFSSRDYQESYCPDRCQDGTIRTLKYETSACAELACFPCVCKKPECQIYGICCPDISVPYLSPPNKKVSGARNTGQISHVSDANVDVGLDLNYLNGAENNTAHNSSDSQANDEQAGRLPVDADFKTGEEFVEGKDVQAHPRLGCYTPENVLYIRSCLPGVEVSSEVLHKCESYIPDDDISFTSFTMVTDKKTNVVYYNKYCADCNGVKQHQMWTVTVTCVTFMRVYTATSQDEFLRQALNRTSSCSIQQGIPKTQPLSCSREWLDLPIIDTCNVTGLWHEYDDDVLTGCSSFTTQADTVMATFGNNKVQEYLLCCLQPGLCYQNGIADAKFSLLMTMVKMPPSCALCTSCRSDKSQGWSKMRMEKASQKDYPEFGPCSPGAGTPRPELEPIKPYSILFNIRDKSPTTGDSWRAAACNVTEWAGPDGDCIPVRCSPGKILIDGNCSTAVTQITGLGYRLQLWFLSEVSNATETRFTIDMPLSEYVLKIFSSKISDILSDSSEFADLSYGALLNTSTMEAFHDTDNQTPKSAPPADSPAIPADFSASVTDTSTTSKKVQDYRVPYLYWIVGLIIASDRFDRQTFEQTTLFELFSKEMHVNFGNWISVHVRPVLMWHDVDITAYCGDVEKRNIDLRCFHWQEYVGEDERIDQFSEIHHMYLNLTQTLTCKFVSFPRSQYLVKTTYRDLLPFVTVKLSFNTTQLTITSDSDLSQMSVDASGELNICCDFLDEQIALMPRVRKKAGLIQEIQYVLTLVCMGVSMACLLVTIVTYVRFAVLRTVAGRNNLCLCLSLLLAQASLLASSFTNVNSALCVPLGMLTHFLWLSLYSWNFLCCFYMYKVFGAKIRNLQTNTGSQNVTLMKNVTFSLLTPAIIVSTVVVGAYITSGGSSLGYGGHVCYLNDSILVVAAMVGPVVLITITNIIFLLLTIYNIHRVGRLQTFQTSTNNDQRNLYVYVKLSSLTGAFWVTYIIAEVSDLDGLRIAAIILNGLQGFFIFLSYTCNNRVRMLYLSSLRSQTNVTTNTGFLNPVPKGRQRNDQHELQHRQSLSSVGSQSAGTSVGLTDNSLVKHGSSLDQVTDSTVPQK